MRLISLKFLSVPFASIPSNGSILISFFSPPASQDDCNKFLSKFLEKDQSIKQCTSFEQLTTGPSDLESASTANSSECTRLEERVAKLEKEKKELIQLILKLDVRVKKLEEITNCAQIDIGFAIEDVSSFVPNFVQI